MPVTRVNRPCLIIWLCFWSALIIKGAGWAEDRGSLYINTRPQGVQIYLDNDTEPRDTTPSLLNHITVGPHTLRLTLPGYTPLEVGVVVDAGKINDLSYILESRFGDLYIETSPPGAEISLGDNRVGVSPLELPHLSATKQQIQIKLEGYQTWLERIKVEPDKTKHLMVNLMSTINSHNKSYYGKEYDDLNPYTGELEIESAPSRADVWIDGEFKGRTPMKLKLIHGDYTVGLGKSGYVKQEQQVYIIPDERLSMKLKLEYEYDTEDMIYVEAGKFIMGSDEGHLDEKPAHEVWLKAFYIDKHEVSNAQYRSFFNLITQRQPSYPYSHSMGKDEQPIVGVSWFDAYKFCKWAGKRLPTEAEWEKAARGTEGLVYPWGNEWLADSANSAQLNLGRISEGGKYPKGISPYGAFDMAGNAWEWCNDYYEDNYYARSPKQDPTGPRNGRVKVLRGGSWLEEPAGLRTTNRRGENPKMRLSNIGFRCAKDVDF